MGSRSTSRAACCNLILTSPAAAYPFDVLQISPRDSFEIAFNAACGLLETGDLAGAEQQLQLATRVGERCLIPPALDRCWGMDGGY